MSKVCRTCLSKANKTFKINDTVQFGDCDVKISFVLRFCIPELYLGISSNPEICYDCKESLRISYVFKKKCLNTENILGDYLKSIRCTARSVDLVEVLGHLDKETKAQLKEKKRQETIAVFNAQDIISDWEDHQDGDANDFPILDVRESAPNPHIKADELRFCKDSGTFVDKQGTAFDFAGRTIIKTSLLKNKLQKEGHLKNVSINTVSHMDSVINNEPDADNFIKITSVYSLSEEAQEKTADSPKIDKAPEDATDCSDVFQIKDEPLDVILNDRVNFNFTPTDEETLDASETASYGNIDCDSSLKGIIDNLPEISDNNQYIDVPDFVHINNFGSRELEELRQQLKKVEKKVEDNDNEAPVTNFTGETASLGNDLFPEDKSDVVPQAKKQPMVLNASMVNETVFINGKPMFKCSSSFKPLTTGVTLVKGPVQYSTVGTQVDSRIRRKRRRRLKIVPVNESIFSINKKPKQPKPEDKDVVLLYTNYTKDGFYINDHDYLLNPYKRNKILIEGNDEWLCMCYICHKRHRIYEHTRHMNGHGCICKVCGMDLGVSYMLNVHVRTHVIPCKQCTEKVPYGLLESHQNLHLAEELDYEAEQISRRKQRKNYRNPKVRTSSKSSAEESEKCDTAPESVGKKAVGEGESEDSVSKTEETPMKRGKKRKRTVEEGPAVGTKRVLRSNVRKSYNETDPDDVAASDSVEKIGSSTGPP